MKQDKRPVVAAFDFDGTLTRRDSLVSFLAYSFGWPKTVLKLSFLTPWFLLYLIGRLNRKEMKEIILTQFLKGVPYEAVLVLGKRFAEKKIPSLVIPQRMAKLNWHLSEGHRCFLVSASIDAYLVPWAKLNGFEAAVTSKLEADAAGCVTGKLIGQNCRRGEKVRRLEEIIGNLSAYELYAYGDSEGDKELLAAADHPCLFT